MANIMHKKYRQNIVISSGIAIFSDVSKQCNILLLQYIAIKNAQPWLVYGYVKSSPQRLKIHSLTFLPLLAGRSGCRYQAWFSASFLVQRITSVPVLKSLPLMSRTFPVSSSTMKWFSRVSLLAPNSQETPHFAFWRVPSSFHFQSWPSWTGGKILICF